MSKFSLLSVEELIEKLDFINNDSKMGCNEPNSNVKTLFQIYRFIFR